MPKGPHGERRAADAIGRAIMVAKPAMAAGITDRLWSLDDIVAKIDEMTPIAGPRGPYKKR